MALLLSLGRRGRLRFTGVSLRTVNSFYPLAPIIGAAFERRDRDDPDVIRLFDVNHRIGERQPEVPSRGRHDGAETGRARADFCQKIVDVVGGTDGVWLWGLG